MTVELYIYIYYLRSDKIIFIVVIAKEYKFRLCSQISARVNVLECLQWFTHGYEIYCCAKETFIIY